jgi:pyruvate/2-oxoglutarate dehydrogenase complex dihydrolipoamide dehydrogenase (E3) component
MIGMARAWISNANYGQLLLEGRSQDLTPCIRCNRCHRSSDKDPWISVCSVDPGIGLENRLCWMLRPSDGAKKIAVIGGGPAGMKAAITAFDRGHQVTIYEKSSCLGGQICVTENVPFKWPLQNLRKWLISQVEKRNIRVVLGCAPGVEELRAENYDVVIAALGAQPIRPAIPGADLPHVMTAVESYHRLDDISNEVVIIGGGEIGVETGIYLARMGKTVTVLEQRGKLAADSTPVHYWKMFRDEWERSPGFTGIVNATVTKITDRDVHYVNEQGQPGVVAGTTVLLAVGMRARGQEALSYYNAGDRFYMVGDCQTVGNIQTVMRSAYIQASQF